jgi:hypothetical protein
LEGLLSGRESIMEGADVAFFSGHNSGESTKFQEAFNLFKHDAKVKFQIAI